MSIEQRPGVARLNQIYEQYVKPVEPEHLGEYVLVTPEGEMIFAPNVEVFLERTAHIAPGDNCLFEVGPVSAFSIL